jgi:hypothetical protein
MNEFELGHISASVIPLSSWFPLRALLEHPVAVNGNIPLGLLAVSQAQKLPYVMRFSFRCSDRLARPKKVSSEEEIGNVCHFTASTCGKRFPIRSPFDTYSFAPCRPCSSPTADGRRRPREVWLLLRDHAVRPPTDGRDVIVAWLLVPIKRKRDAHDGLAILANDDPAMDYASHINVQIAMCNMAAVKSRFFDCMRCSGNADKSTAEEVPSVFAGGGLFAKDGEVSRCGMKHTS